MFSETGSFCLVGVSSNSSVFVSDKDLNDNMDLDEFGLLVRPAMEIQKQDYQTTTLEEDYKNLSLQERNQEEADNKEHHHQDQEIKQQSNVTISVPMDLPPLKNLKLEIPSYEEAKVVGLGSEKEGFKTPTSSDKKIPIFLECPGAPRKTKSRPIKKRKNCRQQIVIDVSQELESLFPMPFVVDLCAGGKNKKFKQ